MDETKDMVDFWRWHYAEMLHEAGWFDELAKLRSGSTNSQSRRWRISAPVARANCEAFRQPVLLGRVSQSFQRIFERWPTRITRY